MNVIYFNSIKVRLELSWMFFPSNCFFNFNSIKVRLERFPTCPCMGFWCLFQFHKGTIRTCNIRDSCYHISNFNSIKVRLEPSPRGISISSAFVFQFHKGTIRTDNINIFRALSVQFQFHKGTIRTLREIIAVKPILWFQFHKGTIRTVNISSCPSVLYNFNSIKVRLEPRIYLVSAPLR